MNFHCGLMVTSLGSLDSKSSLRPHNKIALHHLWQALTDFSEAHTRTISTTLGKSPICISTLTSTHYISTRRSRLNDPSRNFPDLGQRFARDVDIFVPKPDPQDFNWSTVLKRTFEAYLRGEVPNMYGEWITFLQTDHNYIYYSTYLLIEITYTSPFSLQRGTVYRY